MVKALVFDAYGTLFDTRSVLGRCEEIFPGRGSELTDLWRAKQLEYTWLRALMDKYEDFWRITQDALGFACRSLGLAVPPDRIDHLMQAYMTLSPFPEVGEALDSLGRMPCAILSNGTPQMLGSAVRNAGLEGRFQQILSVDEVRTYKPNPVVYKLAETRLAVPRGQIGFVSANGWDVAGAKAFGFTACWLNRRGAPLESLGFPPDRVLATAAQLASVVG
jgi:2-haloacid dehalogenase